MRGTVATILASFVGLVLGIQSALALPRMPMDNPLASPLSYPGQPKPSGDDANQPYALNYADEAAQNLGVHEEHMDVFSAQPVDDNSYLPAVSGDLGGDGAMLKLRWHPGE